MLLTSMIEGLSQPWITVTTAIVMAISFLAGFSLMNKGKQEEEIALVFVVLAAIGSLLYFHYTDNNNSSNMEMVS